MDWLRHLLTNDHGEWLSIVAVVVFLKNLPNLLRMYWWLYVRRSQPPNSNAPGYSEEGETEGEGARCDSKSGNGGSSPADS